MTQQQKLTKVIERAVERGWKPLNHFTHKKVYSIKYSKKWGTVGIYGKRVDGCSSGIEVFVDFPHEFLFSHDFAKAYWGLGLWKGHIQLAVLSKYLIDYYYKNK